LVIFSAGSWLTSGINVSNRNMKKIFISSLLISIIGVFVIDYLSHLLFSNPMETIPYFLGKMTLYFVFSIIFLSIFNLQKNEFRKVLVAGIIVASIWGMYYNVFPVLFDFYPYGIALNGLTFLGMGLLGTGIAFGIVHVVAFVGGYYINRSIMSILKIN
jgi:hypothetical protein